jgi:hypothetical protein
MEILERGKETETERDPVSSPASVSPPQQHLKTHVSRQTVLGQETFFVLASCCLPLWPPKQHQPQVLCPEEVGLLVNQTLWSQHAALCSLQETQE